MHEGKHTYFAYFRVHFGQHGSRSISLHTGYIQKGNKVNDSQ